MLLYEHAHVEPPITPDGQVRTVEGSLDVVVFARLPASRRATLVPDPYLREAAVHAGTAGVVTWPGALRWLALVREGRAVPAIVHNTYVLSRLYGMDIVADPDHPTAYLDDGGPKSVIGWGGINWRSGDIRLASGVPQMLPVTFTDRTRLLAWAQLRRQLEELRPNPTHVVDPTSAHVAFPDGEPPTADMLAFGDLASEALVLGDLAVLRDIDVMVPAARDIARDETSAWAWCIVEGLLARVANACGTMPPARPPTALATRATPDEVLIDLARTSRKARWAIVGGMAALVGGTAVADWLSRRLARRTAAEPGGTP